MSDKLEERRISRRTIAKGAAWAVPTVPLVVATTPAYASSGGGPKGTFQRACKQPGNSCAPFGFTKGYSFLITITNPTNKPIYVYTATGALAPVFIVTTSSTSGVTFSFGDAVQYIPAVPPAGPTFAPLGDSVLIPANGSIQIIIDATSNNSANFTASGTIFLAWGHTPIPGSDPDHPYTPKPPAARPPAYGSGWIEFDFTTTFPPCDKDNSCLP